MTSHKDYRLDQLGITSQYEADELERELDIRFDQFTYHDREVWVQQNAYLDAYAHTRTVTDSADVSGVTVSTAQAWKFLNILGFKRRLEIADLRFSDGLQITALERAREPDAPASLLIALLRAHIPEKFSANGHLCDTSKADEILFRFSQNAMQEKNAGHPTFRAIANGTYQPRSSRNLSHSDTPSVGAGFEPAHDLYHPEEDLSHPILSPSASSAPSAPSAVNPPTPPNRHTGEGTSPRTPIRGRYPENAHPDSNESDQEISSAHEAPTGLPHDDIPPVDPDEVAYFNLSPSEKENTQNPSAVNPNSPLPSWERARVRVNRTPQNPESSTQNPSASSAPSAVNPPTRPIASIYQKARRPQHDPNTFKVKRF